MANKYGFSFSWKIVSRLLGKSCFLLLLILTLFTSELLCQNLFSDGLLRVRRNSKYGFIDTNGKLVIDCQFDDIEDFSDGLAKICKEGKCGFIDKKGNLVIPYKYGKCYSNDDKCTDVSDFHEGLAILRVNDKYGFIDKTGEVKIKCQYDYLDNFNNGLAVAEKNNKKGIIDKNGKVVVGFKYDFITDYSSDGLARVEINDKYGFIDKTGKLVIKCQFERADDFKEGRALVENQNEKKGFIDKAGKLVINYNFNSATDFENGIAIVETKSYEWVAINKMGKKVLQFQCDEIGKFKDGLARARKDGKYGFIDIKGNFIIQPVFESVGDFYNGLAQVWQNRKIGFIDKLGHLVIDYQYKPSGLSTDRLYNFIDNFALVEDRDLILVNSGQYLTMEFGGVNLIIDKGGNPLKYKFEGSDFAYNENFSAEANVSNTNILTFNNQNDRVAKNNKSNPKNSDLKDGDYYDLKTGTKRNNNYLKEEKSTKNIQKFCRRDMDGFSMEISLNNNGSAKIETKRNGLSRTVYALWNSRDAVDEGYSDEVDLILLKLPTGVILKFEGIKNSYNQLYMLIDSSKDQYLQCF